MNEDYRKLLKKNRILRARLKEIERLLRDEFLKCSNNDCRCRQGFGLCSQCKEAAIAWLKERK